MALSRAIILALLAATFFTAISMAEDFIVGDEMGWTVGFDYQSWSANKVFRVGDRLIFKYGAGEHNVFVVTGTDFRNCSVPAASQGLTTGEDVIVLETPGRQWYLCGVGDHCQNGQKLFVNVLPSETEAPSLSPLSSVLPITATPSSAPAPAPWSPPSSSLLAKYRWLPGR
ncbi:basic blue protein-like [Neltuma alba]|uniref:basic blue protein-like n=1 Tax=Neltuma alba TaxID=207710 RepID=UPI0010A45D6C|nr:basic blue protein-like [Prosopis alba]